MTPKDKAKELVDKYFQMSETIDWTDEENYKKAEEFNNQLGNDVLKYWNELSKKSALIAVDEIISIAYWEWMDSGGGEEKNYWQEVKQEIQKL